MTATHTAVGGETAGARIESRSYEYVPLGERHGRTRDRFSLWFGEQLSSFALVTGALAVTMGLDFWWSVVAIIAGNLIGALMMAGHSACGSPCRWCRSPCSQSSATTSSTAHSNTSAG